MSPQTVFMGSSDFSVVILEQLIKHYMVKGVITQPDKPAGRGKALTPPPVKRVALHHGLDVYQPEKLNVPETMEWLNLWKPDFIVVAAYGKILRPNILDFPQFGCLNVHASYLPRWRGASPIQAALLHGDETTGVSIMIMDAGVDTGAVLARQRVLIDPEDAAITLSHKLARTGGDLLISTLDGYLAGKIQPQKQEEEGATYAPMIRKEDGMLDFNEPAIVLERKIRAFVDWPGAAMMFEGQMIKIRKARVLPLQGEPGKRTVVEHFPCVYTSDGCLVLMEVKPAGKNWMSGADFLRGTRNW
jgi:methionyl-tRNA formyltransferase